MRGSLSLTKDSGGTALMSAIMTGKSALSAVSLVTSSSMELNLSTRAVSARELNSAPCFKMEVSTSMKLMRVFKSS